MTKFIDEKIKIVVHANGRPPEPFHIMWDGGSRRIKPGQATTVPRVALIALARAVEPAMKRRRYKKRGGGHGYRTVYAGLQLRYPFTVLRDPSPYGFAWFKGVIARSHEFLPSPSTKPATSRSAHK